MTETTAETLEKKEYSLDKIRNIGIIAHIDAGKTTTTETIMYYTGKTYKIGNIDAGTTQMDWMVQERERGITIQSAATTCFWKDYRVNIIDTPGHVDFTAEVERSLRVLDGAVVVFDGKMGVEPQSETVWRQADKYRVPRMCFVNKLNLIGGDFKMTLASIRERLNPKAFPIMIPIGFEYGLKGWVDLISLKAFEYIDEKGLEVKEVPVPGEMKEDVAKYRHELLEAAVEADEHLMAKYLSDGVLTEEELIAVIRKATITGNFYPVLGGDGRRVVSTAILDAVVSYLPSPLDLPPVIGYNPATGEPEERGTAVGQPFSALAFKIQTDPYMGRLTYFRVYSGTLKTGTYVQNSTKDERERISRILLMHANHREDIDEIKGGEIGATVGLKNTFTGDTLCDQEHPVILESIKFPEPVISVAIEPKTKVDQEKLGEALHALAEEDPTFRIRTNQETGQTLISGMGELHLDIIVDRLKREFHVEADVGAPQVAFRETITKEVEQEGKYIHQSGGHGQYGHVYLRLTPRGIGEGFEFKDEVVGGSIPKEFIPAVEKGVKESLDNGVLGGYPMVDFEVALFDGSFHDVDSSEIAFKIAASEAMKEGFRRAGPVLLEPIMKLEVIATEEFMGAIIGDLNSRRGRIEGTDLRGNARVIKGIVPLAEMFGYATALRSMTSGRASFNLEPSHYEQVPRNVAQEILGEGKEGKKGK
ncbi:MAG: elongation factor G [bacterium]|nr:elongation factor G [bacterium]